jgi:hypothetical protein
MSTNKIDNRVIIALALLLVLAMISKPVWDGREQWQFGQGQDDGIYMVTAKALASGEGYRHLNLPGHPYATKYPPLFPLYMSMAWRIAPDFPRTLRVASILQDCLLPVCLVLLFMVLRQMGLSPGRALLVAAMMFVTFAFIFLAITLYSELLFLCFLLAAIWLTQRAAERDSGWLALLGGFFAGLAYLTRIATLPLLIAVPIFFFLRKRSRLNLFFFALAAPAAIGWHVWGALHAPPTAGTPYLHEYLRVIKATGFGPHLLDQMSTLSAAFAETFFSGLLEFLRGIPLHHLVLAAAIAGSVRIGRRRQWPLYLIFTGLYLLMITVWWFQGMGRLIIPVWPVALAGIVEEGGHFAGLCAASMKRFKMAPRWALIALATAIAIHNDAATWHRTASVYETEREQRSRDRKAYQWLAQSAGPDAIVMAWKEGSSYLYTGLPSSHDWFLATLPQADEGVGMRARPELPAGQFKSAMFLLLASDFGSDKALESFRAPVESLPGSKLEFSSPGALVYRLPMP